MIGSHGHVVPRSDGAKARCGGPNLCQVCWQEKVELDRAGQVPADQNEIKRLKVIIDRQRATAARFAGVFSAWREQWGWIAAGRGPYEWDDARYREEFGAAMDDLGARVASMTTEMKAHDFGDTIRHDERVFVCRKCSLAELTEAQVYAPHGEHGCRGMTWRPQEMPPPPG